MRWILFLILILQIKKLNADLTRSSDKNVAETNFKPNSFVKD